MFGVVFFNFVTLREYINAESFGYFFLDILLILIVSALASLALAYLINKIKHKVKFAPIILLVIIIYVVSKMYHLPALLFILLFGLFIGNLDELIHFDFIDTSYNQAIACLIDVAENEQTVLIYHSTLLAVSL